ncbi:hypothetical protein DFH08DRAFT_827594 [Mycena albidolilacea]|uniref:Uncharacterized protein n=1 Tax=Mycena albidolilacea TaxID=1033008 RepID=A0AAD6YXY4_9AGAR|nr:hypothetical protein DFH08DRAFT_827594 [Mycena albidolilacea]
MAQRVAAHLSREHVESAFDSETSDDYIDAAPPAKKKPRPKPMAKKTSDTEDSGEDSNPKPVRRKPGPKPKKKAKGPKAVKNKRISLHTSRWMCCNPLSHFLSSFDPKFMRQSAFSVNCTKVPSDKDGWSPLPRIHFFWTRFELGNWIWRLEEADMIHGRIIQLSFSSFGEDPINLWANRLHESKIAQNGNFLILAFGTANCCNSAREKFLS